MSSVQRPIPFLEGDDRLTTFPIGRQDLWDLYEKALASFWVPKEVALADDAADFAKLPAGQKHFVKLVLAFFAASDGFVKVNLVERFMKEVDILEVKYFWSFQAMIEDVHAQMYSILLDAIISDPSERERLLNAVKTIPVIAKMTAYMTAATESNVSFAERLLRFACVEGIFFSGCFCAIYWLQQRGLMKGLAHSNELIARDEGLHTVFALKLYMKLLRRLPTERVHKIFAEAVDIAGEFIDEALRDDLVEMNAKMMRDYIKCQADNLLTLIKEPTIYNTTHQFRFMDQINLDNHTNFFERRVSEYSKLTTDNTGKFTVNYDF